MGGVVAAAEAVDVERGDLLAGLPRVPAVAYDDCAPGAVDAQRPRCDDVEEDDAIGSDVALARSIDDAAAAGGGAAKFRDRQASGSCPWPTTRHAAWRRRKHEKGKE